MLSFPETPINEFIVLTIEDNRPFVDFGYLVRERPETPLDDLPRTTTFITLRYRFVARIDTKRCLYQYEAIDR